MRQRCEHPQVRDEWIRKRREVQEPRQEFLSTLLHRIDDKSSFYRCHVLDIPLKLPQRRQSQEISDPVMKAGIDRVKDQSINTRRRALQLIIAVIDELCNEESARLETSEESQVAELQLKTLHEEEERVKREVDILESRLLTSLNPTLRPETCSASAISWITSDPTLPICIQGYGRVVIQEVVETTEFLQRLKPAADLQLSSAFNALDRQAAISDPAIPVKLILAQCEAE